MLVKVRRGTCTVLLKEKGTNDIKLAFYLEQLLVEIAISATVPATCTD